VGLVGALLELLANLLYGVDREPKSRLGRGMLFAAAGVFWLGVSVVLATEVF
jgi:hypothetical protein